VVLLTASCAPAEDPPGRSMGAAREPHLTRPGPGAATSARSPGIDPQEPPPDHKIASIAMRTWIYVAPRERSTKLGYLRAGAVVDRSEVSAGTEGCAGGWYRLAPRGYVCVGKGASLTLDHQVVEAAIRGPDRKGRL